MSNVVQFKASRIAAYGEPYVRAEKKSWSPRRKAAAITGLAFFGWVVIAGIVMFIAGVTMMILRLATGS